MGGLGSAPVRWMTAAVLLSVAGARTHPAQIHQHMTSDELRSLFHVEHVSLVPEYHLVKLTHHLARRNIPFAHPSNTLNTHNDKVPHEKVHIVKKKWKAEPPSLLDDQMFKTLRENVKDVDIIGELNTTVNIHFGDQSADVIKHVNEEVEADIGESTARTVTKTNDSSSNTNSESSERSDSELDLSDQEHVSENQEEDTHRIKLEAFGKELDLVLKRQEGLLKKDGLKMWNLVENKTQPDGVDLEEMKSEEEIGELYQDENSGAALLIRRHPVKDTLLVEGSIGHSLVIRPLPDSLSAPAQDSVKPAARPVRVDVPDDEAFLEPGDMVSIDTGLPIHRPKSQQEELRRALSGAGHVIIRRQPAEEDHHSDYAFMEPDHLAKRYRRKRSAAPGRSKREAPYVIYPEILVIVDYDGYRLHGGDNVQIKRYFVAFWNGVDLRYKLLKGPRIRISIAGIIISRGRDATPYLERNRVGRDAIDSAAALTDMGKYLFRERRLPVYDIAVAITKLDMCRRQYANDACNRGTAGFAYVGGACVVNKRLEKVNSVAIIEDTGGFSGIIVAAHEVGHLLGAVHDGSPPPSYLGGPGAEKCRWEDGFIMSDLRHTEKGFRWSSCSVQSFHHFLNGETATCLYNAPHEDDSLPRALPGRLLTLDAQCRKDRGTSACFKDERVCAQLFCFDSSSGYCVAYRPAAEGSPCGDGQYCINGRCIAEHENIIPDYSQHTPSYLRPDASPFFTNATSIEDSTQLYTQKTQGEQPYETTRLQEHTTTTTTANPYKLYYYTQSTTRNPYDSNFAREKTTTNTYYNPTEISTKNLYQFSYSTEKSTRSSYEASYPAEKTRNPYSYSFQPEKSTNNPYENIYSTEKGKTPYDVSYASDKANEPYEFNGLVTEKSTSYTLPSSSVTQTPYVYNKYSITSTKSPYDFQDFATRRAFKITDKKTAKPAKENPVPNLEYDPHRSIPNPNPYDQPIINTYEQPELNLYEQPESSPYERAKSLVQLEKTTTKPRSGFFSKLDLDGFFNRSTKSPFAPKANAKSLYKIGTYYTNAIRPDASQQVSIEPARNVYSFQANVTKEDGSYTIDCSSPDAYYRPECPHNAVATSK